MNNTFVQRIAREVAEIDTAVSIVKVSLPYERFQKKKEKEKKR